MQVVEADFTHVAPPAPPGAPPAPPVAPQPPGGPPSTIETPLYTFTLPDLTTYPGMEGCILGHLCIFASWKVWH